MIQRYIAIIVVSCSILTSCNFSEKPKKDTIPTMTFTVNRQLLGDSLSLADEGFRILIPKNWKPLSENLARELTSKMEAREAASDTNSSIRPQIVSVFSKPNSGASLIISRVRFPKQDSTEKSQRLHYTEQTKSRIDSTSLGVAEFMSNGVKITQYMIRSQENTSFKLLFKGRSSGMIQCDYILPNTIFQQEIRAVESSIGSILIQ